MTLRIDVNDLPPSPENSDSADYRLSCLIGGEYFNYPIDEGENHIGSSSLCAIAIRAPGVRERHACVKRQGDKLFIRCLGKGKILLHGRAVDGATPLSVGEPFTLGSVTAVAECILPPDREVAVAIESDGVSALLADLDPAMPEMAARQLHLVSDVLLRSEDVEAPTAGKPFLDVLQKCFAPAACLLLRRRPGNGWAVLAELGEEAAFLLDDPSRTSQCERFELAVGNDEYRLLAEFPDPEAQSWRNAFCRLVLALTAASREKPANPTLDLPGSREPAVPRDASGPDAPWRRMAGSRIRSHLSVQTELYRHADQVLVIGETGTGKELAARSLHEVWQRPGPFVAINCAAIGAELLDSELFGVTAGAATGVSARPGRFAQAQGGTLFLDEISEMPLSLQSKLLRVLQEGEYYPVGGKKLEKTDAKVIASSNRSEASLQSEHMRPDLYYRLSQAVLTMPPLLERLQDLAELCEHILNGLERQFGRNIQGLSVGALACLKRHDWPGNVRELQNLLRNLYMGVSEGSLIRSAHLPPLLLANTEPAADGTLARRVRALEREVIREEIHRHPTIRAAAGALGLSEGYLYRKLKKLDLVPPKRRRD